jgi:hypothetical protein
MIGYWMLLWRSARQGKEDGRQAYPACGDPNPPHFLFHLKDTGETQLFRLEHAWLNRDKKLYQAWVRWDARYQHAKSLLDDAVKEQAEAAELWNNWKAARAKQALLKTKRQVARIKRKVAKSFVQMEAVAARRKSRFLLYKARVEGTIKLMDACMAAYAGAHLRHRDDQCVPPGLREESRPRIEPPASLQEAFWEEPAPARDLPPGPTLPM